MLNRQGLRLAPERDRSAGLFLRKICTFFVVAESTPRSPMGVSGKLSDVEHMEAVARKWGLPEKRLCRRAFQADFLPEGSGAARNQAE